MRSNGVICFSMYLTGKRTSQRVFFAVRLITFNGGTDKEAYEMLMQKFT